MPEMRPWEQRDGEPDEAYEEFLRYKESGWHLNTRPEDAQTSGGWSPETAAEWEWDRRCWEWDLEVARREAVISARSQSQAAAALISLSAAELMSMEAANAATDTDALARLQAGLSSGAHLFKSAQTLLGAVDDAGRVLPPSGAAAEHPPVGGRPDDGADAPPAALSVISGETGETSVAPTRGPRCGQKGGDYDHRKKNEKICDECREYQREQRRSKRQKPPDMPENDQAPDASAAGQPQEPSASQGAAPAVDTPAAAVPAGVHPPAAPPVPPADPAPPPAPDAVPHPAPSAPNPAQAAVPAATPVPSQVPDPPAPAAVPADAPAPVESPGESEERSVPDIYLSPI